MSKKISLTLGWIFIVIGLIGYSWNGFLGMHLSPAHNFLFLITGVISWFFGCGTLPAARGWCIAAGLMYTIVSLVGLFAPPGTIAVSAATQPTNHLLRLIPGTLAFATVDSCWQLLVGVVYLIGGLNRSPENLSTYEANIARATSDRESGTGMKLTH